MREPNKQMEKFQLEKLDSTRRDEALDVLAAAFRGHPMLPPDPTGRRSRLMVVALLDAFANAPDATLFGFSQNGELACVAFVFADGYEPKGIALCLMLWRMVRALGLGMWGTMGRVLAEKKNVTERRLELMLLGTRRGYQGQGLGRKMLHHLFEFSQAQGYASVVLEAPKETPAFGLYQSEGFEVEKELTLPAMPLCMMRRALN